MDIDFVIPWVNGDDPVWLREKKRYCHGSENQNNAVNRYRDWGLLPFWFRGIEAFTPWVHKVYFVTCGHLPEFLNTKAAKLQIVRHEEFIPREWLPTFSSHVIELNFHHIPGMSNHFVYFNDDMFMLRPLQPEYFFCNGLPCTSGREMPLEHIGHIGTWQHAMVNNLGLINANFSKRQSVNKFSRKYRSKCYRWKDNLRTYVLEKLYPDNFLGFENIHGPSPYLKSVYEEVWKAAPEKLISTCQCKFRTSDNLNQWVMLWWQVASGQFIPASIDNCVNDINSKSIESLCQSIQEQKHDFVCLNDPDEDVPFEYLSQRLKSSFEKILPNKCSFEK